MKEILIEKYIRSKILFFELMDNLYGNKNYKKFVIISDSRTGSTLLMQLLNSHPNVITKGEEFKNLKGKSCRQIWNKIFRNRPRRIKWVGFKLFYFHPREASDREVWDFLEKDKDIVIIHLVRRNFFRSYVSKKIGLKTRLWTENIHKPHQINQEDKKVKLKFTDCKENFEKLTDRITATENRFKGHKILPIIYEDLDADKQKEMERLFKQLEIPEMKISTYLKKQNPEPLEELVLNYKEIKENFKGSKWEYVFDLN